MAQCANAFRSKGYHDIYKYGQCGKFVTKL